MYPCVSLMVGSGTPWKETATLPMASTVWLDRECERREYLWGGLIVCGSTLGSGAGGGLGGKRGSTAGGPL